MYYLVTNFQGYNTHMLPQPILNQLANHYFSQVNSQLHQQGIPMAQINQPISRSNILAPTNEQNGKYWFVIVCFTKTSIFFKKNTKHRKHHPKSISNKGLCWFVNNFFTASKEKILSASSSGMFLCNSLINLLFAT